MWDGEVGALAVRSRVSLWDMRGHGQSGDPRDPALYSPALTVGDMAAVLDACGEERAIIGGLSLGGVMSLAFHLGHTRAGARPLAVRHPPRFPPPPGPAAMERARPRKGPGAPRKGAGPPPAAGAA